MAAGKDRKPGWFHRLRGRLKRAKKAWRRLYAEWRPARLAEKRNRKKVIDATVQLLLEHRLGTANERLQAYLETLPTEDQRHRTLNRVGRELGKRLGVPMVEDPEAELKALDPYREFGGRKDWVRHIPQKARGVGEHVIREIKAFRGILAQGQSLVVYLKKQPSGRVFQVSYGFDGRRFQKVYQMKEGDRVYRYRVWLEGDALDMGLTTRFNH